ncbi:hypothetical protein [Ferruginivarius sediminum]|uniref:Uncharacterized protein n=1 Tax=Ferruginivarius sediminum TaxID=2661937 RepID=A0A369TGH1_9PROT|nr:hypothetical protein [Ferruginivarius sediminum]RDD62006.1 hypothetical protein DRB17_09140 [Ferruginivarius sediminum]
MTKRKPEPITLPDEMMRRMSKQTERQAWFVERVQDRILRGPVGELARKGERSVAGASEGGKSRSTQDRDIALAQDYLAAAAARSPDEFKLTKGEFGRQRGMKPDTARRAINRGLTALEKKNGNTGANSR